MTTFEKGPFVGPDHEEGSMVSVRKYVVLASCSYLHSLLFDIKENWKKTRSEYEGFRFACMLIWATFHSIIFNK